MEMSGVNQRGLQCQFGRPFCELFDALILQVTFSFTGAVYVHGLPLVPKVNKIWVIIDHFNHKNDLLAVILHNSSKQKYNTNYEDAAAHKLFKYKDRFGAVP